MKDDKGDIFLGSLLITMFISIFAVCIGLAGAWFYAWGEIVPMCITSVISLLLAFPLIKLYNVYTAYKSIIQGALLEVVRRFNKKVT